jgi:hypothetical protein
MLELGSCGKEHWYYASVGVVVLFLHFKELHVYSASDSRILVQTIMERAVVLHLPHNELVSFCHSCKVQAYLAGDSTLKYSMCYCTSWNMQDVQFQAVRWQDPVGFAKRMHST